MSYIYFILDIIKTTNAKRTQIFRPVIITFKTKNIFNRTFQHVLGIQEVSSSPSCRWMIKIRGINTILSHYYYRVDTNLGKGIFSFCWIPCTYPVFVHKLINIGCQKNYLCLNQDILVLKTVNIKITWELQQSHYCWFLGKKTPK